MRFVPFLFVVACLFFGCYNALCMLIFSDTDILKGTYKMEEQKDQAVLLINELKGMLIDGQAVPLLDGKVVVDKNTMIELLDRLYETMEQELKVYREVTDKRARIINEAKEEADQILFEAEQGASRIRVSKHRDGKPTAFREGDLSKQDRMAVRTANDIYAASLIYTDEMLTEVDHLVNDAYRAIASEFERVQTTLKKKVADITANKSELMKNLDGVSQDDRYSQVLEIAQLLSNELYEERKKQRAKEREEREQMDITFDEEPETAGAVKKKKVRPEISEDRTAKKIEGKKAEALDIKTMDRSAETAAKNQKGGNRTPVKIVPKKLDE